MNKEELKRQIKLNSHLDYDKVEWRPASVYVPVVLDLIDQLDEPEKVVVPQFVAEHIDKWKKSNVSIGYAFTTLNNKMTTYGGKDADVHDWLYNQEDSLENQEIYARAWLDGFSISEPSEEMWKPVKGYEGLYEVSNKGGVKSLDREVRYKKTGFTMKATGVILKPNELKKGYLQVGLSKDGKRNHFLVHRLVMDNFKPTENENLQVNHMDGDKGNNDLNNLEWVTAKENTAHAYENGLRSSEIGNNKKLTENEVLDIIELYETGNYTQKELGEKYGVNRNSVGQIISGKAWGWLTGIKSYAVEEKKYRVIIRDGEFVRMFLSKIDDKVAIGTNADYIEKQPEVTHLTEQEIKDYDERYWPFAEEVTE